MSALRLGRVAPVSAALFVLGFSGLAVRGAVVAGTVTAGVAVVIVVGATLLAVAVLGATAVFAACETLSGRAWALGFRRLAPGEATLRGIGVRALRYATFLWLCNGAAFVVAGFR